VKSNANAFIPAATSGTGGFSAWVQAVAGNNTLTIEAEDFSPQANTRTATYRVQVNGSNRVLGYDFNGNLIDNGSGQTYEWDAENRLVKITYADQTSTEFRYDGQSRRVGITEKDASRVVTSEKRYLWAEGAQPAEERAADGRTVVKQYHAQGEFLPGAAAPLNKVFYTKDHLGSVRELVNGNGTLQTRYDYDLWGGRTKITGTVESEVGYTGHHHHGKSGLVLTWYRAYDPVTGRWLSRDPIGEAGGINLYGYVGNNPVNWVDPFGLIASCGPWRIDFKMPIGATTVTILLESSEKFSHIVQRKEMGRAPKPPRVLPWFLNVPIPGFASYDVYIVTKTFGDRTVTSFAMFMVRSCTDTCGETYTETDSSNEDEISWGNYRSESKEDRRNKKWVPSGNGL